MVIALSIAGVVLFMALAFWAGHHTLKSGGASTGGTANALGGFADVFDPGRARAQDDLDSKGTEGEALPTPNDEDVPMRVDLGTGKVHIKRPTTPQSDE